MRSFVLFATAALLIPLAARAADQPDSLEGWACFENLPVPEYPKTALQSHIDGSVWTWTQVDSHGAPGKPETQVVSAWSDGAKLLTPPVEKAIQTAKIKPSCAGKKLWVVFRYQINGASSADAKIAPRTDGPNVIWIETQPAAPAAKP